MKLDLKIEYLGKKEKKGDTEKDMYTYRLKLTTHRLVASLNVVRYDTLYNN